MQYIKSMIGFRGAVENIFSEPAGTVRKTDQSERVRFINLVDREATVEANEILIRRWDKKLVCVDRRTLKAEIRTYDFENKLCHCRQLRGPGLTYYRTVYELEQYRL